jgi:hypothetical protein
MITIVTRWETTQMPPEVEWQMWRQLKGAFEINRFIFTPVVDLEGGFSQAESIEEALQAVGPASRVFLEPSGYNALSAIPTGDIVIILGNTNMHNMEHAEVCETYKIHTPGATHLYGVNAAAIALAVRYGQ